MRIKTNKILIRDAEKARDVELARVVELVKGSEQEGGDELSVYQSFLAQNLIM